MTAEILHSGHIRAIKKCQKYGYVIVGLLSDKALKGYKECVVPFKHRKEVLEATGVEVVKQDRLDPYNNLEAIKPDYIASGDGFTLNELNSAIDLGVDRLKFKYHKGINTTAIKNKILYNGACRLKSKK